MLNVWRAAARFFFGVPDDEAAPCLYCREAVAPGMGERDGGQVFCTAEHALAHWEATTA